MSKRIVLMSVLLTMLVSLGGRSAGAANIIETLGAAFLNGGSSYVPLKSTASLLGAPLRWDAQRGQAIMSYQGQDLALTPNSLKAVFSGQPVTLTSPTVVVNGVTYVPTDTLRKYYNVPVAYDAANSQVRIKGPNGWGTAKVNNHPSWQGGPPPWAPAWGWRRGHGVQPGYAYNTKPSKSNKAKAWSRRGHGAQGDLSNAKPNGNRKAKAWGQRGNDAQGHPSNGKPNGNGKSKGNDKGH